MSGGFEYEFTLSEAKTVEIKFDYSLKITSAYESNEYGEVVVALDGTDVVVKRLQGRGGTYSCSNAGEVVVFPNVQPGSHKVTLGAYNNQKTTSDEDTHVTYDNVKVTAKEAPA